MVDRLSIGIDFDGTLADTNTVKAIWIRENLGITVPPYMCDATSCIPIIGHEAYRRLGEYAYSEEVTLGLSPMSGSLEVILRLRELGDVAVVTARTGERLSSAEEWLSCFEETRGVQIIGLDTRITSKLSRCADDGIGVLIDDDERHLLDAGGLGIGAILFKQNAPEDLNFNCATVCPSWLHISRLLGDRASLDHTESQTG